MCAMRYAQYEVRSTEYALPGALARVQTLVMRAPYRAYHVLRISYPLPCNPSTHSPTYPLTHSPTHRYFTTATTSRYSDCTRVVPSVARLWSVHNDSSSRRSAALPVSSSEEKARMVGPYH